MENEIKTEDENVINTKRIVDELHERFRKAELVHNKRQTKELYENFVQYFIDTFMNQMTLKIKNLGIFTPVIRKPKHGRNPLTGQPVIIPSKRNIQFKVSQKFYQELQEVREPQKEKKPA